MRRPGHGECEDEAARKVGHGCHDQVTLGFVRTHGKQHVDAGHVVGQVRVQNAFGAARGSAGGIEGPRGQWIVGQVFGHRSRRCHPIH